MEPIIRFDTKSRLAYDAIKNSVTEGVYPPGQKIGISQIAKQLQTSDIPVREAMQKLEAEGFLEYTPHVGFRVTRPEFAKYTDVYDVRQILESEAAGRAARLMSPDSLVELQQLHDAMRRAAESRDLTRFSSLNSRFHAALFASCGNPLLIRQIDQVRSIYPRTRAIFVMFPERTASALQEHEQILLQIEKRDVQGAKLAYLEHMARGYEILLKYHQDTQQENVVVPRRQSLK